MKGKEMLNRIRKLLYWLPVIWRDRDWDPYYLYAILEHKLAAMERNARVYDIHTTAQTDADKMRIARILCSRLMKDDYLEAALMHPDREWGYRETAWEPCGNGYCELMGFRYDNATTPEEVERADHDYLFWGRKADEQRARDVAYLFAWIARFVEMWWS